jgi:hypothetical protein
MVPGWVPYKIASDSPALHSRWLLLLKKKFLQLSFAALVQVKVSSNFNCSYIARSSLTYIPLLAHLAFRPCELLSSLFVHRPSVHISHFNLLLRNHWANCNQTLVEWSLGGPLPTLCSMIPTFIQDGRQA